MNILILNAKFFTHIVTTLPYSFPFPEQIGCSTTIRMNYTSN